MAARQGTRKQAPAKNEVSRENQLISLADELAEKKLRDGTASNQLILHYINAGSPKRRLEIQKLEEENKLLRAKTEAIQNGQDMRVLLEDALTAFRRYSGNPDSDEDYDE